MIVFFVVAIGAGCAGLGYVLRMVEEGFKAGRPPGPPEEGPQ